MDGVVGDGVTVTTLESPLATVVAPAGVVGSGAEVAGSEVAASVVADDVVEVVGEVVVEDSATVVDPRLADVVVIPPAGAADVAVIADELQLPSRIAPIEASASNPLVRPVISPPCGRCPTFAHPAVRCDDGWLDPRHTGAAN